METPAAFPDIPTSTLPRVPLSDGRLAAFIRRPKAVDVSRAQRIAGPKGTDVDRSAALLAQIVTIDGTSQRMEDLLDLDLDDFTAIGEAVPGKSSGQTTLS